MTFILLDPEADIKGNSRALNRFILTKWYSAEEFSVITVGVTSCCCLNTLTCADIHAC